MHKRIIFVFLLILVSFCVAYEGARYLIIAPDSYVSAVQPLANWKTKKGVKAVVVPTSVTGSSNTQIKNYIVNAYNNWRIKPEYILLVGAGNILPSWSLGSDVYSDDPYADLTGNLLIELSIGRFPCTSTSQCQNIVNKIISYERTPFLTDTTWYRKGTTIVREDGTTHPDTVYWNDARFIHSFWRGQYTIIDSFSRLRGDDRTDVVNAINNGRSYVVYRGLATVNWYMPFQVNVNNMTNGYKLPIVVSGTCATMSLSYETGYLGDQLLNYGTTTTPKGAVGFFATSVSTSGTGLARLRGAVTQGFFTALYRNNIFRLGDAAKRAKFIVDSLQLPYYNETRYREWNLFGDPEMNMWTNIPRRLSVTHDTLILTVPQYYTVRVNRSGTTVSNALVCLMMDSTIYYYDYTNNAGEVTFLINPTIAGTMSVTVTAQNCQPYEKNVTINLGSYEHNVAALYISEPQGTVISTTNIIPKVKIKNFGTSTDTCSATFKIGTIYNQTVNSIILSPNDTTTVSFPVWTAIPGFYSTTAFVSLNNDQWRADDTVFNGINVIIGKDLGVDAILSPDSMHLQNTTIIPKIRIKNYGALPQTNFTATCSIIGANQIVRYTDTETIISVPAYDTLRINFSAWTPTVAEVCTVKIRTNLIADENSTNDQKIKVTRIMSSYITEQEPNQLSPNTILYAPTPNLITKGSTQIKFNLSYTTDLSLKIYDASGKLVKTLVNRKLEPGFYNYTWDCLDDNNQQMAEGIYFISLQTARQHYTQKIILTH